MKKWLNRESIFIFVAFLLLIISFTINPFKVEDDTYRQFDRGDESNIISRLHLSKIEGLLSRGGLTGSYYYYKYHLNENEQKPYLLDIVPDGDSAKLKKLELRLIISQSYDDYIRDREISDGEWKPYKTQPGGQAFVYGMLDKVLPFDGGMRLMLYRMITIALSVMALILFTKWVLNNWGFIPALVTFILIFISPWFLRFAYNLWWALWSYYIPFITMLFVLDKRRRKGENKLDAKIFGLLFLTVLIKFFFTGAEFITSTLVMSVCPIIFHLYITQTKLNAALVGFIKSSLACVLGVLVGMLLLVIQIRMADGYWMAGIEHILHSFVKRSPMGESDDIGGATFYVLDVVKSYFQGEVFYSQMFTHFRISFGMLILFIVISAVAVYSMSKKIGGEIFLQNKALLFTLAVSIIGPLSWIIIFAEHAHFHIMFDYIVWYMPFLLYGYCMIGVLAQLLVNKLLKRTR